MNQVLGENQKRCCSSAAHSVCFKPLIGTWGCDSSGWGKQMTLYIMLFTRWFSSFLTLVLASWKEPGKFHPLTLPCICSLQRQKMPVCLWFHVPFGGTWLWCPLKCWRTPVVSAGGIISSSILTKWLNVHNESRNLYEPWAACPGMSQLLSFSAFWFKRSLPCLFLVTPHLLEPSLWLCSAADSSFRRHGGAWGMPATCWSKEMAPMGPHFWDTETAHPSLTWKVSGSQLAKNIGLEGC